MKSISTLKRIGTVLLVLSLMCGMLLTGVALPATAEEDTTVKIFDFTVKDIIPFSGGKYVIGGKTGTAETLPRDNGEYVVSFIGHAPADDPQIAIYVVVDRANAPKQDNARFATIIVRNILTEVLPYLNIFMTEELSEAEMKELQDRHMEITNMYTQNPEEEALENLENETTNGDGHNEEDTPSNREIWMSYPIDPVTGNRINPETGKQLDPDTGEPADSSFSAMGSDVPVNENLLNQPAETE